MIIQFLLLGAGLVLLLIGAQRLVVGASALALKAGLTPLVIGLTVVAFGTSAPELAISVKAATSGQVDLAVGNIVGSNIFNILFILGFSALIAPLVVSRQLVRLDVPIMVATSILFFVFASDGLIVFWESLVLIAGLIGYTFLLIILARKETSQGSAEDIAEIEQSKKQGLPMSIFLIVIGLVLLILGSRFMVDAAVAIATALGVSEVVVGLTIVAIGTSLPEVATSVMATLKGERDIAVGNVVGSNVFNLMGVGGAAGLVSGAGLPVAPGMVHFDLLVMIATAGACLPIFFNGYRIARWEGVMFLSYYVFYTVYLILDQTQHPFLGNFSDAMKFFVLPLTAVTLTVVLFRAWKLHQRPA